MLYAMQNLMGIVLRNRVNNQELWEIAFVVTRGDGASWFSQVDVIDLFE